MRVISINTNGIRAATKKGFIDWMKRQKADVICVQETKAQVHQLGEDILAPKGYKSYFYDAEKKGYSGVAIYSKVAPDEVIKGGGWPHIDCEGRLIRADYGNLSILSLYMPSGSSKEERQVYKY
ncbi:MAG: exodeoxyribonuclease III, partial [Myxococcota bacterium]|nr:exodeoxyribonuclease III [Myxococcota bacterium]